MIRDTNVPRCPEVATQAAHRGKQCIHTEGHVMACGTAPHPGHKHGFKWHVEGRTIHPVAVHAARHGIKWGRD